MDWRTGQCPVPMSVQRRTSHSRKTEPRSAIIHRTVRCATGLSDVPAEQRLLAPTVDCKKRVTDEQCAQSQSRRARGAPDSEQYMFHGTPDCPVPQEDNLSNGRLSQNPNGWVMWRRTGQCPVAQRTVRCAYRQQPSPTAIWWLGSINTPQPPQLQAFKSSEVFIQIQELAHSLLDTNQKIKASPSPKFTPTT